MEALRKGLSSAEDDLSIAIQYDADRSFVEAAVADIRRIRTEIEGIEQAIKDAFKENVAADAIEPVTKGVQTLSKFQGEIKKERN